MEGPSSTAQGAAQDTHHSTLECKRQRGAQPSTRPPQAPHPPQGHAACQPPENSRNISADKVPPFVTRQAQGGLRWQQQAGLRAPSTPSTGSCCLVTEKAFGKNPQGSRASCREIPRTHQGHHRTEGSLCHPPLSSCCLLQGQQTMHRHQSQRREALSNSTRSSSGSGTRAEAAA